MGCKQEKKSFIRHIFATNWIFFRNSERDNNSRVDTLDSCLRGTCKKQKIL